MVEVPRSFERPTPDTVERLTELGVSTVHEALSDITGDNDNLLDHRVRPIDESTAFGGPAMTVLVPPGDNLMIHVAIELCQPGDVLVVGIDGECTDAVFGDQLATSLQSRGVAGVVIDGGVRDVAALRRRRFPVFARAISARGVKKAAAGKANVTVVCAGVEVTPGDIIVADQDGVVVVPLSRGPQTAENGEQRRDLESIGAQLLAAGHLSLDLLNLRPTLSELGIDYT